MALPDGELRHHQGFVGVLMGVGRGFVCASFANLDIRVSTIRYTFTPPIEAVE